MNWVYKTLISVIILMTTLSVYKFYTVEKGTDDCMLKYVSELMKSEKQKNIGGWYYLKDVGTYHIDINNNMNLNKFGYAYNCFFIPDKKNIENIILAAANSNYCLVSYILLGIDY